MSYSASLDKSPTSIPPCVAAGCLSCDTSIAKVVQVAQRILCSGAGSGRQQLIDSMLAQSASLTEATDIILDAPGGLSPEVQASLKAVGAVAERVLLLPTAAGAVRYFLGKHIYCHVLDGVELIIKQAQDTVTVTPAVAKMSSAVHDRFDRNKLAPVLGRLGIVPPCLEHSSEIYISQKFSEDGVDFINRHHQLGLKIPMSSIWSIFKRAVRKVAKLHSRGLIHHDFKLDNLVVQLGDNSKIQSVKLIDLDSLRFMSEQHIALELLLVAQQLKRSLERDDITDLTVLQEVCNDYEPKLRELRDRLSCEHGVEEGASQDELHQFEHYINSEQLNNLTALMDVVEGVQSHPGDASLLLDINKASDTVLASSANILSVMYTPAYASPEFFDFLTDLNNIMKGGSGSIDCKIDLRTQDVWSIGVATLVLFMPTVLDALSANKNRSGRVRLIRNTVKQLLVHPELSKSRSAITLVTCLDHMLQVRPQDRWTMQNILDHLKHESS